MKRPALLAVLVITVVWASAYLRAQGTQKEYRSPPASATDIRPLNPCPGPPFPEWARPPKVQPKYRVMRFNTKVRVTNGFYQGMEGRLYEPLEGMKYGVLLTVSVGQPPILARVPHDYLEVIVKAEKE